MMVSTITLLAILNFYLLFKFNIYKILDNTYIIFDVPISYLMVPIEWVIHQQKECGYCRTKRNSSAWRDKHSEDRAKGLRF